MSLHRVTDGAVRDAGPGWVARRPCSKDGEPRRGLYPEREKVFRDIQRVKERLGLNVEFARPEQFVPPLAGTGERHVFIDRAGGSHYDPYALLLSKIVRGFRKDLRDAEHLVESGMVDPERFRELVREIPDAA